MFILEVTQQLLAAEQEKKLSFAELGKIVVRDEILIASLFYRQATASESEAEATKLIEVLGLNLGIAAELTHYPQKRLGPVVPTDPLIYRFYEIIQIYRMPLKDVIQEKFGDGIMSAIDFTLRSCFQRLVKNDRQQISIRRI